jgi:hypothetical protein
VAIAGEEGHKNVYTFSQPELIIAAYHALTVVSHEASG